MFIAAWVGVLASIAGCGGAGVGAGPVVPANAVRPNVTGDMFSYSVTGTYAQAPSILNKPANGTETRAFQAGTFNGQPALQSTDTTVLTLTSGQKTLIDSFQESSSGVTLGQTDGSPMQAVTSGGFAQPTTLSASTSISGTETLANGTTITFLYAVTGNATVTTPAGTFACWTVNRTLTYSDGYTANDTIEFAPTIGAPVQAVIRHVYPDGFSDNVTTSLTAYAFGGT